ncbi:MAG: hypothetical protein GAK35_01047 [Herbaspirillum frisingense]|uniref:Uncharacterized protein n=1 Tax=Herbaspirillum frisingense TaxID=92645 RepID=A0A7V8JVB7_9BURK|nr:MAG: hypothetical protein GAK35_01047 [Herbaspirillum frisingense]
MNEKNPSTPAARGDQNPVDLQRLDGDIVPPDGNPCCHSFFEAVQHGGSLVGQCNKCGFRPDPVEGDGQPAAEPAANARRVPVDANVLEQMARERPDECFLKGSGILKLTSGIRYLEGKIRELGGHVNPMLGEPSGHSFRQRPLPVQAFRLPPAGEPLGDDFEAWCSEVGFEDFTSERDETLAIETGAGTLVAEPGDWIVKGPLGDFVPCSHAAFPKLFEPLAPSPAA